MVASAGIVILCLAIAIGLDCLLAIRQTRKAKAFIALGNAAFDDGNLQLAQRLFAKAVRLASWIRSGPVFFLANLNLGNALTRLNRFDEAEVAVRRAFRSIGTLKNSRELGIRGSYPEVRHCIALMAECLVRQAKYPDAIPYYESLVTLWREAEGGDCFQSGFYAHELGLVCYRLGLYEQSMDHLTSAVEVLRNQVGPHHSATATALTDLGEAQIRTSRLPEAEKTLSEALDIRLSLFGPHHESLAAVHDKLASLCVERADYDDAAVHFDSALRIRERALGSEHPQVAAIRANQADALRRQGRLNESEQILTLAMGVLSESRDPNLSNALEAMAGLRTQQGSIEEAAVLYRRSRELIECAPSGDLSRRARLLHNEARLRRQLGEEQTAEELATFALTIRETVKNTPVPVAPERLTV